MGKNRVIYATIGLLLGILMLLIPTKGSTYMLQDHFNTPDNPSFLTLSSSHLVYKGVGHKQLTVMGGTYTVDANYNLSKVVCYGADITFLSPVRPASILSVGCLLNFTQPSRIRLYAIAVGSKIEGTLETQHMVNIPSGIIYTLTSPFRHNATFLLALLLIGASILAMIKPLVKPSHPLNVGGIIIGMPVFLGIIAAIYIVGAFFVFGPSLRHMNITGILLGSYIHLFSVYLYIFFIFFGIYYAMSVGGILAYTIYLTAIIAIINLYMGTVLFYLLLLVGYISIMLIPDMLWEKYRSEQYYRDSNYKTLGR